MMSFMKKYFLTGLVTLLPLAITVWVGLFIINFLTAPFVGLMMRMLDSLPIPPRLILATSRWLVLIGLFLFTIGLGAIARLFLFKAFMRLGDRLVQKIPLFNKVYKTTRDIIQTVFNSDQKSFQQVVMVSFPYPGCFVLGLVIRPAPQTCSDAAKEDLVSVFLPTTPNPTTGYLIIRPKAELIYLDMPSEDAFKYIVSCGVVPPEPTAEP